jgi:TetR/AcrR family transcriptional regulator
MNKTSPPPRLRDAARSRQALLEAGLHLFAEQGYDGTSVDAICRAAGVNKAMVSYHFGGKAGLHAAILTGLLDPVVERLTGLAGADTDPETKLRGYFRLMLELHHDRTRFPTMVLREVLAGGDHLDHLVRLRIAQIFDAVRRMIQEGVDKGQFRPVDPFLTYLTIAGSLMFFFATETFRHRMLEDNRAAAVAAPDGVLPRLPQSPPSAEDFVSQAEEMFLSALRRADAGGTDAWRSRS